MWLLENNQKKYNINMFGLGIQGENHAVSEMYVLYWFESYVWHIHFQHRT